MVGLSDQLGEVLSCMGLRRGRFVVEDKAREIERQRLRVALQRLVPQKDVGHCYAGFCGPWLEDLWLDRFGNRSIKDFGVFVPVFVPWLQLWKWNRCWYFGLLRVFGDLISPSFLYVTVSQNDDGVEGSNGRHLPENVFVVSAGGKGHVPFLLLKGDLKPLDSFPRQSTLDTVFMGSRRTHYVRSLLYRKLRRLDGKVFFGKSSHWVSVYSSSKTVLCPRGFGRNSFRLTEALQLGLVPVYVYTDICWLPYFGSLDWSSFAFIVRIGSNTAELGRFMHMVSSLTDEDVAKMRKRVRSLYHSHFTVNGSMNQLFLFLKYGFEASDLRCAPRSFTR